MPNCQNDYLWRVSQISSYNYYIQFEIVLGFRFLNIFISFNKTSFLLQPATVLRFLKLLVKFYDNIYSKSRI